MKLITCQEIRDALEFNWGLEGRERVWLFDKHFCALSQKEMDDLLDEIGPIKMQFRPFIVSHMVWTGI